MTFVNILYGSHARGEADARSDVDLVTIDDSAAADYTWSDLNQLRDYGSLFLWHLRLEGVILDADDAGAFEWASIIQGLPAYTRARQDCDAFEVVLRDVLRSLNDGGVPTDFEGAVVARTVRHASILACYLDGQPDFSRYSAVASALELLEVRPECTAPFENLYDLVLEPGSSQMHRSEVRSWAEAGLSMVGKMRGIGDGDA